MTINYQLERNKIIFINCKFRRVSCRYNIIKHLLLNATIFIIDIKSIIAYFWTHKNKKGKRKKRKYKKNKKILEENKKGYISYQNTQKIIEDWQKKIKYTRLKKN